MTYSFRITMTPNHLITSPANQSISLKVPSASLPREGLPFDIAVADVEASGSRAHVTFLCGETPGARERLLTWARRVGFERVQVGDTIEEAVVAERRPGTYETECLDCGQRLAGNADKLRNRLRTGGCLPCECTGCGGASLHWTEPKPFPVPAGSAAGLGQRLTVAWIASPEVLASNEALSIHHYREDTHE